MLLCRSSGDRQGATGRETLTIHQIGPFFAALRVFLSDRDTASLGLVLNSLAGSFQVDASAPWGTRVAAINPAELRIAKDTPSMFLDMANNNLNNDACYIPVCLPFFLQLVLLSSSSPILL